MDSLMWNPVESFRPDGLVQANWEAFDRIMTNRVVYHQSRLLGVANALEIAGSGVGAGHPCFVIAEAGVNHNGSFRMACQMVDRAAEAGADAVKFQTFQTDRLVTRGAPKAEYQRRNTARTETQFEMLRKLELGAVAHRKLAAHCRKRGILFISTPFDEPSADLLEDLEVPLFKIPSGEITNHSFLAHVAKKGRSMIISTGMAYLSEVEAAVRTIRENGNPPLALLHCVSSYPASPCDINLRAMDTLRLAFGVPVGYSDHTPGFEVAFAAVALGACILEKHFTLDRSLSGPDHKASLEPGELNGLVAGIRNVEAALGHGRKEPTLDEMNTAAVARKSLVAASDLKAGTPLKRELIVLKRPGTGLSPSLLPHLLGRRLRQSVKAGDLLTFEVLQ